MAGLSGTELGIVGAVVLLVLLIAWWIMRRPAERVRTETVDVLTPGAVPAARNTLLVDAPVVVAPPGAELLGGIGEVVSAAVADEAARATPAPQPFFPMGEMARTAMEDDERARAETASQLAPADDLTRIKGLGPKIATLLRGLGITRFDQIATWSEADVARIDPQLGTFQGRIARDNWIEQARYLSAGDVSGFESRFGKV